MFLTFYNKGIVTIDGFSPEARFLIGKYSPGSANQMTRKSDAIIRVIREIGDRANHDGARWVVVELDDRYDNDNHRIVSNDMHRIPDKDKTEWIEVRENADSPWVTLLN